METKTLKDEKIKNMKLEELEKAKNQLISELELIDEIESLSKNLKAERKMLEQMRDKLDYNTLTDDERELMLNDLFGRSMVIMRMVNELTQKKQEFEKIK